MRAVLYEVKVNTLEISGKVEAFNRQIEMIIEKQIKLKCSVTELHYSLYSLNFTMEGTEERGKR